MNETLWLSLAFVHLTAVITPGANFLAVTQTSLTRSRQAGLWVARGVLTGSLIHITAGIIGVAVVIAQIPVLFAAIRVLGGLYFAYAGIKMLRAAYTEFHADSSTVRSDSSPLTDALLDDLTPAQAYRRGLLTHLSNPASMLYYVSLFTGFVPITAPLPEKLLIALLLLGITGSWYSLVAYTLSQGRVRQFYFRLMPYMNALFGILWIVLAAKLILA